MAHTLAMTRDVTGVFIGSVVVSGLVFHWRADAAHIAEESIRLLALALPSRLPSENATE